MPLNMGAQSSGVQYGHNPAIVDDESCRPWIATRDKHSRQRKVDGNLATDSLVAHAIQALEHARQTCEPPTYIYSPAHLYYSDEADDSPSSSDSASTASSLSSTPSDSSPSFASPPPPFSTFLPARIAAQSIAALRSAWGHVGFALSPVYEYEVPLTPLLDALPLAESYVGTTKRRLGFSS
jgi:hypothetical protein